ncbi:DUF3077 domain-containing protein [Pseudomonas turukhanskensis]|uniref:DUF3077 domain-containing protein n=1 Tax=Pseudomonas turukhanskensis TaxID=1806536 RepID=A0A9W6K3S2_9PSED|nr:DUF3077 domain-containing protein [Pseudomonas turukhanskensis]GLK87696.1 hypothetical protein GCM10017655_07580 [Pseudomonas turukhanskensis]
MNAVTHTRSFCMPDGKPLFSVNAGVDVSDALEQASILLSCLTRLSMIDRPKEDERNTIQYLLEITSALVEASLAGLAETEKAA